MQPHGKYQMWDKFGSIMEETYYSHGLKNGSSKQFYTAAMISMFESDPKNIGKVARDENFKDNKLHGTCKYYKIHDSDEIALEASREYDEGILLKEVVYYDNGTKKHTMQHNGLCEQWYDNGQKEAEFTMVDGFEDGKATVWYRNGKIAEEPIYRMGQLLSEKNYYINGNLLSDLIYDETTRNLVGMKEYAYNQNLSATIEKTGEFTIKGTTYDTITKEVLSIENLVYADFKQGARINFGDGEQEYKGVQAINHGHAEYYFKGKLITSGEYHKGYRIGKWKIFYNKNFVETTNLDSVAFFRQITFGEKGVPQGMVIDYYASGAKQWEGLLIGVSPDVFTGECKYYYESGQLMSHQYHNNGIKTGTWNSYYQNGNLTEKVTFFNDKPDGDYIQLWENGNKKQEGVYAKGLFDGDWKYYNEEGQIVLIEHYQLGVKLREERP
jgi:antitoxin component YwqK of YwqJK toxin-antitoxin module